jgi:hypothetical protein
VGVSAQGERHQRKCAQEKNPGPNPSVTPLQTHGSIDSRDTIEGCQAKRHARGATWNCDLDSRVKIGYHFQGPENQSMITSSDIRKLRARQCLIFGILLLTLAGAVEPHTEHALSLLTTELEGSRFQPSACHPWQAPHAEAAGAEQDDPPCAACIHFLQSIATQQAPPPGFVVPDRALSQLAPGLGRPFLVASPSSSRAPPHRA